MEYDEEEIQEFVRRAQQGDRDAMAALFDRLSDRIYRYLRFRVRDQEIAEDLTQTVFVEMLQALQRYKRESRTKFSTAACGRRRRQARRSRQLPSRTG